MTNRMTNPAKNRNGVLNTGLPSQIVAIHENTATELGIEITMLAAPKMDRATVGKPVANIW